MRGIVDQDLLQVTVVGPKREETADTEHELDRLFHEAYQRFDADEVPALLRLITRSLKSAQPAKNDDLDGLTTIGGRAPSADEAFSKLTNRLIADFARRKQALRETLKADQVARILGVSRQAVYQRHRVGKLFAITVGDSVYFPSWQFDPTADSGLVRGVEEVGAALASSGLSGLEQLYWLTTEKPQLSDKAPVELLREGKVAEVVSWARAAGAW